MKLRTLGTTTAALAMAAALAPAAQAVDEPNRIVGGSVTTNNPGAVSLHATDRDGLIGPAGQVHPSCSASLLDANSVLTARHCVDDARFPVHHLRVGSLKLQSGGTTHRPARVEYHPSADVAVITLATPVSNPRTVTLASTEPSRGQTNTLYGWGRTSVPGGSMSPDLKQANVPVTGFGTDAYGGPAITSGVGNGHAWKGDSGGPQLNAAGQQVGVCSEGSPGAYQDYASVPDNLSWIRTRAGLS